MIRSGDRTYRRRTSRVIPPSNPCDIRERRRGPSSDTRAHRPPAHTRATPRRTTAAATVARTHRRTSWPPHRPRRPRAALCTSRGRDRSHRSSPPPRCSCGTPPRSYTRQRSRSLRPERTREDGKSARGEVSKNRRGVGRLRRKMRRHPTSALNHSGTFPPGKDDPPWPYS